VILRRNNIIPFLIFLLGIADHASAQQPEISMLRVANEDAELQINFIEQDPAGYVWLGTDIGILKFDGLDYDLVPLPDSLLTDGASVTCLFLGDNNLCAGFSNGYLAIIPVKDPKQFTVKKISDIEILSIAQKGDALYIGTNGRGLFYLKDKVLINISDDLNLRDNVIHQIELIEEKIILATDLGLSVCENKTTRNYTVDDGLTDNLVLSLSRISNEEILMGMHNGTACILNMATNTTRSIAGLALLSKDPIHQIATPGEYKLLINTRDEVFMMKNETKIQHFNFNSLKNESWKSITDFIISTEGNFIAANGTGSLIQADFSIISIQEHDGVRFADAHAITCDEMGSLWFANDMGVYQHAAEFSFDEFIIERFKYENTGSSIISLCNGKENDLWFGTYGAGLGRLDKATNAVTWYTEKNGLINNNVISIATKENELWLATLGGACVMKMVDGKAVFNSFGVNSALGSSYVYCVFIDRQGRVWLGTDGKGLVLFQEGEFIFYREKYPECGRSVVSINEDGAGNIWFYSTQSGLQRIEKNELITVPIMSGKKKIEVFSLTSNQQGEIMLLTSDGLAIASNKDVHFVHRNLRVRSNYIQTIAHDEGGRMWLSTDESIIRYEEFPFVSCTQPRTIIEGVFLFLQPHDSSIHELKYDQNHIAFEFTSIWLQHPDIVTYQYKLDGYDLDWANTKDRRVVFSKLAAGNYLFRVRSSHDGDWENAQVVTYSFIIKQPFFQTWWFALLLLALSGLIAWMFVRIRWQNLSRKEGLQRERIQSQFETLRNQINPHFLFNSFNTLITTIGKDKEAAIDYVENLSDYFRIVLQQREKEVITLHEELELVNHYLFLQQKRFGGNFICKVSIPYAYMDSIIPPMTLHLLVENAVKHNIITASRPLTVSIQIQNGKLTISNTLQEKVNKEKSTGVGLDNIRNRYRILFDKEIEIVPEDGRFEVRLPIVHLQS
jgi:ligand-binding sensor domain-containing protein/uncharacterized membrane-anchored protein YhcB (DUF1043 family)